MISYIMTYLLLIFVCSVVNSQARTLTEKCDQLDATSRKTPLPAAVVVIPRHIEMIAATSREGNFYSIMKKYWREKRKLPPPSPKEAPPTHQVTGGGVAAPENYGKEGGRVPPPAPHHAPPTHQVTGGGVVAAGNYGKKGGGLPPPTPHYAPPTHQVSGGGAAALDQPWPYLLLTASA